MSENETTATADVADTSEQQTTSQPAAAVQAEQKDPQWLGARLDRERKKILSELGVEKFDDAKSALAELKKIRDAEKTEAERLRAQVAELTERAKRSDYLDSVVSIRAKAELAGLSDTQREAVLAVAGEDSAAQLKAVELLRPTWQSSTPAEQPKPAPKPAPANTASAKPAPKPGNAESESVVARYERLKRSDPMYAAQFRLANLERYTEELKSRE